MDWTSLLFSFHGRINRAKYWLIILIYVIVGLILGVCPARTIGLWFRCLRLWYPINIGRNPVLLDLRLARRLLCLRVVRQHCFSQSCR